MIRQLSKKLSLLPWLLATIVGGCTGAPYPQPEATASIRSSELIDPSLVAKYCPTADTDISYDGELVITAPATLADPCRTAWDMTKCKNPKSLGVWSFGHLMREAAGGSLVTELAASQFILRFLNTYLERPVVNGQTLEKRDEIWTKVIRPWRRASPGCSDIPTDLACTLDLKRAPFQLLAVLNRMDLRSESTGPYSGGIAGEGRFVFGFLDEKGKSLQAALIFEYRLPAEHDTEVKDWALRWHALSKDKPGSSAFNDQLQMITDDFVNSGARVDQEHPNGTVLHAVRSSEVAFAAAGAMPKLFEFREFALGCLDADIKCKATKLGQQLRPGATAQTPPSEYATDPGLSKLLTTELDKMEAEVLTETHVVPASLLAGAAQIEPGALSFRWPAGPRKNEVRRLFALSTCTGCHFRETLFGSPVLQSGFHIDPQSGILSPFLARPIKVRDLDTTEISYNERFRRQCEFRYLLDGHTRKSLTAPSGRAH